MQAKALRTIALALTGVLVIASSTSAPATTLADAFGRRYGIGVRTTPAPFQWLRNPARQGTTIRAFPYPPTAAMLPTHFNRGPAGPPLVPSSHESAAAYGISCVPFARAESGISLTGNAAAWWDNAAGVYRRGNRPESGSVLSFAAADHMPLGHVAVVSQVVNDRLIAVDHANWGGEPGGAARAVPVMDVSPANDWTLVRVAQGHDGGFGSAYRTSGFIYNRPDERKVSADARH